MKALHSRDWDLAVPRAVRELARQAARADGTRLAFYVTQLIVADIRRRGWPVPELAEPSAAFRIRSYVRAHGPVHAGLVASTLDLKRVIVDAVLSRSVSLGLLERVGEGIYQAPARPAGG